MEANQEKWSEVVPQLVPSRERKPRKRGFTMVIDKGLGIGEMTDLLRTGAGYIDWIKFAFGTSVLYPEDVLMEKIELIRSFGVGVYPGGTLLEIAVALGEGENMIRRLPKWGFTAVEVSEGTIDLSVKTRDRLIRFAKDEGLDVLSEIGKKDKGSTLTSDYTKRQIKADLKSGSRIVIIEGRDSGQGVGTYDDDGHPRADFVKSILDADNDDAIMWEAPLPSQHVYWIKTVGPNVNLGNVQPQDVLSVEAIRCALRGDTIQDALGNFHAGGSS